MNVVLFWWKSVGSERLDGCSRVKLRLLWTFALLVAFLISFSGNMERGLLETTEGRYAECAREMVETGNFLEPSLDYQPHWTKPPLAYWSMASGMLLAGSTEAGVRLASCIVFLGTIIITALLARRLWDNMSALLAIFVGSTSVLPLLGTTFLSTDMLLAFWETFATGCYLYWVTEPGSKKWLVGMWLGFGFAFLTKGPPGLLPLLAIIPWHLWRFRQLRIFPLWGMLGFAVLAFGWFGIIFWRHPELLQYYIHEEVVGRIASDTFHRNAQWYKPFLIYAPLLLFGQIHWLWQAWPGRGNIWATFAQMDRPILIFLGLWITLPLLVFWFAKSRLPLYLVPLSAPMTLGLVFLMRSKIMQFTMRQVVLTATCVLCLTWGGRVVLGLVPMKQNMRQLHNVIASTHPLNIAAVVDDKAYGLQFYTGGKVRWITDAVDLQETLTYVLNTSAKPLAIAVRTKKAALVQTVAAVMTPTVYPAGDWSVFVIDAMSKEASAMPPVPSN